MALLTVTHYPGRVPEGSALRVPIRVPAGEPHRNSARIVTAATAITK